MAKETRKEQLEKKYGNVHIEDCPFCGAHNFYTGPMSAMTTGIKCRSCPAQMEMDCYDSDGQELDEKEIKAMVRYLEIDYHEAARAVALYRVIKKWNTRPTKPLRAHDL